jgi:hypothetical protein
LVWPAWTLPPFICPMATPPAPVAVTVMGAAVGAGDGAGEAPAEGAALGLGASALGMKWLTIVQPSATAPTMAVSP